MRTRHFLLAGAGLVLLLAALVLAAALLVPEERIGAAAARRAELALGQPVHIGGVRLLVFPRPGARIRDVVVGGGDSTAVAAVDRVDLRARFLPLLRGRVVVDRLALDRPRVFLQLDSAGEPNLRLLARRPDTTRPDTAAAPGGGRAIAFDISGIEVDHGRLAFRDERDGRVVRLDGWSQRLRVGGEIRGGELATADLTGWIAFDDVDARLPGSILPARNLRVRLDHDATLDLGDDRLDIRDARLAIDGVTLAGNGVVRNARSNTGRTGQLRFQARDIDAGELMAWIPDSLRQRLALPDGRAVTLAGTASLDLDLQGPLTADSLPAFLARLAVADGAARAGDEALLTNVALDAALSRDSLAAAARGEALGEAFTTRASVRSPADPTATIRLDGGADLARLRALGLIPDTAAVTGRVAASLGATLPIHHPARARLDGTVRVTGLRTSGLGPTPVAVPAAVARFEGNAVSVDSLPLALGPQGAPLLVRLRAANVLSALADSTAEPIQATVVVSADSLDLDALLGPSRSTYPPLLFARLRDRPVDGRSAGEAAAEAGLALPALPRAEADVRVVARRLVRNGLSYRDVRATIDLSPEKIALDSARLGLMGGTVTLSGELRPLRRDAAGAPVAALLAGDYVMSGVSAAPFFDRLTPFRDRLRGSLALDGTVRMTLDSTALPLRESLLAGGTVALSGGSFAGWPALDSLAGRVGLPSLDTIEFRDWAGSFGVRGTAVTLDETVIEAAGFDGRAAGTFDLGGALDLGATLFLPRETVARAAALGRQLELVADSAGRVAVGVRITGTASAPKVAIDLSAAAAAAQARARAAAQQEAERLARRGAADVAQRLGLPDSLAALGDSSPRAIADSLAAAVADSMAQRADSLRAAAQEALRKRLRKILPGGGGG